MKKIIIILATIICVSALASETQIKKSFKSFYYSTEVNDRFCRKNVENFAKYLKSINLLDENFKLIIIEAPGHPWTFGRLPAFKSRFGKYVEGMYHQNWTYHAIGLYKGEVYDFSFDRKPRVLKLTKYMDEMYLPTSPYLINGETFRTRGMGPYFTRAHAKEEREDFDYNVYSFDSGANSKLESPTMNYKEFLNY